MVNHVKAVALRRAESCKFRLVGKEKSTFIFAFRRFMYNFASVIRYSNSVLQLITLFYLPAIAKRWLSQLLRFYEYINKQPRYDRINSIIRHNPFWKI